MKQTLEFAASELAGKIESGEIAPNACVRVTIDVALSDVPVNEEAARKVADWKEFVKKHSVSGTSLDVSRESFYEGDTDW